MRFLEKTIMASLLCCIPSIGQPNEITLAHRQSAIQLESKAISLIDNNQTDEGLALMKKAIEADPTPLRHMNYGSILFGNGVALFKAGDKTKALETFYEAQDYLSQAILGFDPHKDNAFLAHCNFLLGEIRLNAFSDADKAKQFYQKALSYYPHPGAQGALEKLQQTP